MITVSGCSSPTTPEQRPGDNLAAPHASPTSTSSLSSTASISLPIEDYLLKNDEHSQILYASKFLVRQCMARFGFDYAVDASWKSPVDPKGDAANMVRRYGVFDTETAARYGYHPAPDMMPAAPVGTQPMSDAESSVFLGDTPRPGSTGSAPKSYKGQKIPSHGCSGEAERKLGNGLQERLPEDINDASYQQSMSKPQVTAAFQAWSTCMKKHGYTFRTPLEPLRDQLPDSPSAAEIKTAKTDVACKHKTNLIGTWVAVESAIQKELIERNQEALTQVHVTAQKTIERSAKVIAEGSVS
ncbi:MULTISPECIES: hypothetical protein [Streptomyces]|uniref:hypothetical protein n=1 Tax=Streptomyces TaxID=1883 RepID=UPI001368A31D|nr:hypothetical protein [Streptomyces sp. SID2888]MYV50028.1 hypothetical protein [Streptomyces sp. SID2888]